MLAPAQKEGDTLSLKAMTLSEIDFGHALGVTETWPHRWAKNALHYRK